MLLLVSLRFTFAHCLFLCTGACIDYQGVQSLPSRYTPWSFEDVLRVSDYVFILELQVVGQEYYNLSFYNPSVVAKYDRDNCKLLFSYFDIIWRIRDAQT